MDITAHILIIGAHLSDRLESPRWEGLIDLACLTDGWERRSLMYARRLRPDRWPQGARHFERVLKPHAHMDCSMLGDDPDFTR